MKIAVIGGGINGLCTAWLFAKKGHEVTLYERDKIMQATSRATSKLLQGGLRYMENAEFRLVREAAKERLFWLKQAPHLTHTMRIYMPVYADSRRPGWLIKAGLTMYDMLTGKETLGKHKKENLRTFVKKNPGLKTDRLKVIYSYTDVQMYDEDLGLWVGEQARKAGVEILENYEVTRVTKVEYTVNKMPPENQYIKTYQNKYDQIYNIAGPWAEQLLRQNSIKKKNTLDLVRGSHILFNESMTTPYILEVPGEVRIFFVLPYKDQTLVGTTEVRQTLNEPINATIEEKQYLLNAYNYYFSPKKMMEDISSSFAGVRPLVYSSDNPNKATREQHIVLYSLNAYRGIHTNAGLNELHIQTNGLDFSTILDMNESSLDDRIISESQDLIDNKLYGDLLRGFWTK